MIVHYFLYKVSLLTSRQPRTSDWLKSRKDLEKEILGRVSWVCSVQIVKYSISNRKFNTTNLEDVTCLAVWGRGKGRSDQKGQRGHARTWGRDCGRKKRINNLNNSGHQIIKKVPNEIEFGLYKCNKVWLKIYKKNEMCNEGRAAVIQS